VLWIIWCLAWAGFWFLCAVISGPAIHKTAAGVVLLLLLAVASVAAILLPVGKPASVKQQQ
jgi:hypothetical protein